MQAMILEIAASKQIAVKLGPLPLTDSLCPNPIGASLVAKRDQISQSEFLVD
jgi:hypothetical protein